MKMWNKLSKKAKQKLWGIVMIIISVLSIIIDENNDATFAVIGIPLGLWLFFTKKNIMFYEEGDEELL